MPLTSAEKQARYRARNLLTADAGVIAEKLMGMEDRVKLVQIVALLKNRLEPTAAGGSGTTAAAGDRGPLAAPAARTRLTTASPARSPSRSGCHIARSMKN